MGAAKMQILTSNEVNKMIKRLAYQVYERNFEEKELVIAGINGRGTAIAALLCEELAGICKIKIHTAEILLDKKKPSADQVKLSDDLVLKDRSVIVVDDVLNTARTFVYALLPFLGKGTRKIQTLVLVDRNHRLYPVSADYIGLSLSTTLQEHVQVEITNEEVQVFLN